jgi:hypothetical protein
MRARLGDRWLCFFGVRLIIWLLAAKAFLPGVLLDPVDKIGYYHDEHSDIYGEESARRSYVEYHQLPQWDPSWCGGVVALSSAGSMVVAPDFLLRIIYGTLAGRRLALFLFVILGMEGTFRYARANGASAIGAATGAVAFSTSGGFPAMLGLGWGFMFHYNLVPWAALGFELGLRRKWWIVVGGVAVSWLLLSGGTYALPYTVLVLAFLTVFETGRALFPRQDETPVKWWRPAATFVGVGVVGALLSSIRLVPLLGLLSTHTRLVAQKDQTSPLSALAMLALPREHANLGTGAGEYFIGTTVFLLAVLALVMADRRAAKFWAIALFFGVFACGEFIDAAPYLWMRKLPLYSQLRFPIRMLTIVGFFIALASTFAITRLEDVLPRVVERAWERARAWRTDLPEIPPLGRAVIAVAVTALAAWLGLAAARDVIDHTTIAKGSIYNMDGPQIYKADTFRQARGNRWDAQVWAFVNRGSLHCFDEIELFESPYLRGDLPAEEYPAPESPELKVERISWSPHEIVVHVQSDAPGRFLVNMNHANAWRSDVGTLGSDGGLISVRVPAGDHRVTLSYVDWRVRIGAFLSLAVIGAFAWLGAKRLRRRAAAFERWFRGLPKANEAESPVAVATDWVAGAPMKVRSRADLLVVAFVSLGSILYAVGQARTMTTVLRRGKPLTVLPAPQGDERFGLPLALRRKIFDHLAAAEPQARAEGKKSFPGPDLAWSADDHRGAYERKEIPVVMAKFGVSMTQAYLVLDEGIREHWPGPDGQPLNPKTTPLHPRRNYGW